jgi:hypothetical protein
LWTGAGLRAGFGAACLSLPGAVARAALAGAGLRASAFLADGFFAFAGFFATI